MSESSEWATVAAAAVIVGRSKARVYAWLDLPENVTGIRRMTVDRFRFVHVPTLLDYEATVKIGRPRK